MGGGQPGRGRQRILGAWTRIHRASNETVRVEGGEVVPSLLSRPALWSQHPQDSSAAWEHPP